MNEKISIKRMIKQYYVHHLFFILDGVVKNREPRENKKTSRWVVHRTCTRFRCIGLVLVDCALELKSFLKKVTFVYDLFIYYFYHHYTITMNDLPLYFLVVCIYSIENYQKCGPIFSDPSAVRFLASV